MVRPDCEPRRPRRLTSGRPDAKEEVDDYEWAWVKAHCNEAMTDALTDTQDAFDESRARGENLSTITEEADQIGADLAAKAIARRGGGKGKGRGGYQQASGATDDRSSKRQRTDW